MRLPRRAYDRYMRSPEWLERRAAYFAGHPRRCAICPSDGPIELHHVDYSHLGNEPDDDLVPLCNYHHAALHAVYELESDRLTLRESSASYLADMGADPIDPGPPRDAPRNQDRWLELVTVACPTCEAEPGEACVYEHRGRVRIVTAGGGHKARKAAASRARRIAS